MLGVLDPIDLNPSAVEGAVHAIAIRCHNPPATAHDVFDRLAAGDIPRSAAALHPLL